MSRALPYECEHGRILDWGDFGGEGSLPEECEKCVEQRKDRLRAAVVPLLDLEPAAELVRELIDRIPPVLDFPRDATTWTLAIICAALGLGEDTEGGEK